MSDEIKEFAMPVISLTPMAPLVNKPAPPALLTPKIADAPEPACCAPTVSFDSCTFIGEENGHTLFDVTIWVDIPGATARANVVRRIAVNNATFAAEAGRTPTFYIEDEKKNEGPSPLAKRMRELSGIPHRGNFV